MEKKFNVTGTCIPEKHYMVDTTEKIKKIMKFIENEEYFIINRPRQYGKTTTLYMLEKFLEKNGEYLVVSISFEGVGDLIFEEEQRFSRGFLNLIARSFFMGNDGLVEFLKEQKSKVENMEDLSYIITQFIKKANKKVILMIDEVDKSSNNQLFLTFLGMLRNKYLLRNAGKDFTFHSVILAGVHDVKTLKLKLRSEEERKYNSPWNIAVDFNVDMSFSAKEIKTMLDLYIAEKNIEMDEEYFSEKLHYYTSGYPFLVSSLCKIIDEKIIINEDENSKKLCWQNEYLDKAVKLLLAENNTNFESVIKNLENNIELYELVKNIIIQGVNIEYSIHNPIINLGIIYGIFKNEEGKLIVHNRIYEQLIYGYMLSKVQTSLDFENYNYKNNFITPIGKLDLKAVLVKFQAFMKLERSEKLNRFLENDGRLVFLAFLSPIINGFGFAFKEVQISDEKRLDVTITFGNEKNIIEAKLWRGEAKHLQGLEQLWNYLDINGLNQGYLLIFDFRKETNRDKVVEEIEIKGKKIFVVWV